MKYPSCWLVTLLDHPHLEGDTLYRVMCAEDSCQYKVDMVFGSQALDCDLGYNPERVLGWRYCPKCGRRKTDYAVRDERVREEPPTFIDVANL